jgi:hypothetical protein
MRGRRSTAEEDLIRWREVPAAVVLKALCDHCKADSTFRPAGDPGTTRWHGRIGIREFEFILSGPKFFDTRTRRGGGGAVDLAMVLLDVNFRRAVSALQAASL